MGEKGLRPIFTKFEQDTHKHYSLQQAQKVAATRLPLEVENVESEAQQAASEYVLASVEHGNEMGMNRNEQSG